MLTVVCSGLALMAILFGPLLFVPDARTPTRHESPAAAPSDHARSEHVPHAA